MGPANLDQLASTMHHPKERIAPLAAGTLGPFGLPLRPGEAVCTFYSMYGICKFGSTCKFDHPLAGYYNYGVANSQNTILLTVCQGMAATNYMADIQGIIESIELGLEKG